MKRVFQISFLILFWTIFSGQLCTKEIIYAKNYFTQPYKAYFQTDKASVIKAIEKTLDRFGYEIQHLNEEKGSFITSWRPVEGDSHYFNLFGRKDYGMTDGAYYQLTVDTYQEGNQLKVTVGTTVKTIVGKLHSSGKVERKVIAQLNDYLRSPQIEMTNVGVKKK